MDARFKADKGLLVSGANSIFSTVVGIEANLHVIGSTIFVGQDLIVNGNLVYQNTSVSDSIVPTANGLGLGLPSNRFDLYAEDISVSQTLIPTSNSVNLGNTTNRWLTYSSNTNVAGTLVVSGNVTINTTALAVNATNKRVGINAAAGSVALTVSGASAFTGNVAVTGEVSLTGSITANGTYVTFGNSTFASNTTSVTTTNSTVVDSWPKTTGKAAKIFSFVDAGNNSIHSIEMMIIQEGTNVLLTKYGEVYNSDLGTFDANINGANVEVSFVADNAGTYTVKTIRQMMI